MTQTTKNKITIDVEGETLTHIEFRELGYATLCGLDGDDDSPNGGFQRTAKGPAKGKVNCDQCCAIWEEAVRWKGSDFIKG